MVKNANLQMTISDTAVENVVLVNKAHDAKDIRKILKKIKKLHKEIKIEEKK